jgi:hypothetical protein
MIDEIGRLLFLMLAGHAYADFALQDPWHSAVKYPGNAHGYPWPVALACHGLIHGGLVALATGVWWIGALEAAAHAGIDYGKSRGWYGARADQLAHFVCKIIWMIIVISA